MLLNPESLGDFILVCGHYGCGKTNLSINLALDLAGQGKEVTLMDLDIVNPYFRSSDYGEALGRRGVRLCAPNFAHTNLDVPSLPAEMGALFEQPCGTVIVDVGGDDAGATALGRYSALLRARGNYQMLYVVNRHRPLTAAPADAAGLLAEIEQACRLKATGVVNNSHLQSQTTAEDILRAYPYGEETARLLSLPLMATTLPFGIDKTLSEKIPGVCYPVKVYVQPPWQQTDEF